MPKIIDVILHEVPKYELTQVFVVVDESPKFLFERNGDRLDSHHDGFYESYKYDRPTANMKAFAGREFELNLTSGDVVKCSGQWWSTMPKPDEPIVSVGVGTIESLERCYVFCGAYISKAKLDAWLESNTPSTDYYKYDKNRK